MSFDLVFRSGASALAYFAANRGVAAEHLYADEAQGALAYTEALPDIEVPALVLWGEEDGIGDRTW